MKKSSGIGGGMLLGIALTALFWPGFWRGEGLIGGDLYTYFLPQKVFYAESLEAGVFPLWNPLVGHGYPLIAESQTGAFYPPNLLAYQLWDVNTAYNILQISHYALAFVFMAWLATVLGCSLVSGFLAGLIFVYGWFPAHITHEWAILTGAWMPAAVLCAEKLISNGSWRYVIGLAIVLALQMLPGHFHIAFITQVLVVGYALARVILVRSAPGTRTEDCCSAREGFFRFGLVLLGCAGAFGLAAMQLAPTWELKTLSQRSAVGTYYDPAYGHIPIWYWSQIVAPFHWYGTGADLNASLDPGAAATNAVEAHLYFGLLPVLLLIYGLFTKAYRNRRWWIWWGLGILALVYATGWLLAITKPIPGFHFFRGVGRWGIVTSLSVALLSAQALEHLKSRFRGRVLFLTIASLVLLVTAADLRIVRGLVGDGVFVEDPPILHREKSPVRGRLQEFDQPARLFCRGANLPTLTGSASTPVYLGIGPDEYFDPETAMPEPLPIDQPPTREQIDWLQNAGVTHVLSFSKLDRSLWPADPVWEGYDPLLSRAWGRGVFEPLYLYRLKGSRGRAAWLSPPSHRTPPQITEHSANRVVIQTESDQAGTLILTDLMYPGWVVLIDDRPAEPLKIEGMYRGVQVPAGRHLVEWVYRPASQVWGYWISGISGALLIAASVIVVFRDRKRMHRQ